ncbi:cytochrome c oxidase subunit II [Pelagibacterium montanilacus]|uniref:cytochrome c oxidase subunit II n=1 Tax=Pelagibacterium montanilacus TaxID=2185280 RepID=UPI001FEB4C06|nr:cytochrome c oxidase subunit II [Pelagibacterium montanilacus]
MLGACSGPLSALDPAGPAASSIATLWWTMLVGAALLFLLVMGLLLAVYIRPGFGSRLAGTRWMLYGGLVMPTVVLTALVVYALVLGERILAHPDPRVQRVSAHGVMWDWRFSYPDNPGAAPTDELHIPAGEPVDVLVTSGDVIHSFWVPRLAGKIDAIPGHENIVRITADRPGTYRGVCAEFCGLGHTDMRFTIIAHEPDDYQQAVMEAGS